MPSARKVNVPSAGVGVVSAVKVEPGGNASFVVTVALVTGVFCGVVEVSSFAFGPTVTVTVVSAHTVLFGAARQTLYW